MTGLAIAVGIFVGVCALEAAILALAVGYGRRLTVFGVSWFVTIACGALFRITLLAGGSWPALGVVLLLGGEVAGVAGIGRVRLLLALAGVLLANLVGTVATFAVGTLVARGG